MVKISHVATLGALQLASGAGMGLDSSVAQAVLGSKLTGQMQQPLNQEPFNQEPLTQPLPEGIPEFPGPEGFGDDFGAGGFASGAGGLLSPLSHSFFLCVRVCVWVRVCECV
jgi:hypothetical protein